MDNRQDGVDLDGEASVTGNIICGNVESGVSQDVPTAIRTSTFRATGGARATGPTHPDNPGGSGDALQDAGNGGTGDGDFDPWIDTITGSADAATEGSPSAVSFQFSDAGGTVFLGEGAGPFEVTTDNGTVSPSTAFINAADGTVEVTLTPDHAKAAPRSPSPVPAAWTTRWAATARCSNVAAAPVGPTPTPAQLPETGGHARLRRQAV